MGDQRPPLQPGEPAPAFTLPAANLDGEVSLGGLRGQPFLIGFYRGLHCPFCRRQVLQLAQVQPALQAMGLQTLAVINTPLDNARLYFGYRPTSVTLLCDEDCASHHAFGVPYLEFLPDGSSDRPAWPYQSSMAEFMESRINPTGELPAPVHPMEGNAALNAVDGFTPTDADQAVFAHHGTQLVGHFLVDADGIVRWVHVEATTGPNSLSVFPNGAQIIAAAGAMARPPA